MTSEQLAADWRDFRHQHVIIRFYSRCSTPPAINPAIELMVPSLLHVRAVSVLQQGLRLALKQRNLQAQPRSSLATDINALANAGHLTQAQRVDLHRLRADRLEGAHEVNQVMNWSQLDGAVSTIEDALIGLQLIRPTPKLDFLFTRSRSTGSADPTIAFSIHITLGVTEDDQPTTRYEWAQNVHKATRGPLQEP